MAFWHCAQPCRGSNASGIACKTSATHWARAKAKVALELIVTFALIAQLLFIGAQNAYVWAHAPEAYASTTSDTSGTTTTSTIGDRIAKVTTNDQSTGISTTAIEKLEYTGSSTYQLTFTGTASATQTFQTTSRTQAQNGSYSVEQAGYYLVELWGGSGGSGADVNDNSGGDGGAGGYVYGIVKLDAGDTLLYTLGTNGADKTISSAEGGANGGGSHGSGSYAIGAGGGYSAVCLVSGDASSDSDTSTSTATDTSSIGPTEDNLNNNCIMIAGGGGGGGAADTGSTQQYKASGGSGGSNSSSNANTTSGSATAGSVRGTYFAGSDGQSSGTSVEYVGRGGTDTPGSITSTVLNWFSAEAGKSWDASGDSRGAGGSGNLSGGAGGAGLCGGSGGIMLGLTLYQNIGGGGGGSSFVANSVNWQDISGTVKGCLNGVSGNPNSTGTGGAMELTFLGSDSTTLADMSAYKSVTLSGAISKYFDIEGVTVNGVEATEASEVSGVMTTALTENDEEDTSETSTIKSSEADVTSPIYIYDKETGAVLVTGINMIANNGVSATTNELNVVISLKTKSGFLGGNNVPIISNTDNTFNDFVITLSEGIGPQLKFANDENSAKIVRYCNVPLNISVGAKSFTCSSTEEAASYSISSLFTDKYEECREQHLSSSDTNTCEKCAYLGSISNYSVTAEGDSEQLDLGSSVTIPDSNKATYTVSVSVTPEYGKDEAAVVGPIIDSSSSGDPIKFSSAATVTVSNSQSNKTELPLNNNSGTLTAEKSLTYDEDSNTYTFGLALSGSPTVTSSWESVGTDGKTPIKADESGWYAVAIKGGSGGNGGGAISALGSADGGKGASAKLLSGYVYLNAGDLLEWNIGENGVNGQTVSNRYAGAEAYGYGGSGGSPSWLKVGDKYYAISAGAGGGGGGAAWTWGRSDNGGDGEYDNGAVLTDKDISTIDLKKFVGGVGVNASVTKAGSGGSTPKSYSILSSYDDVKDQIATNDVTLTSKMSIADGKSGIVIMKLSTEGSSTSELASSSATLNFSKYFAIDSITKDGIKLTSGTDASNSTSDELSKYATITYSDDLTSVKLSNYATMTSTNSDGGITYATNVDTTFLITLKPKDGFLGGNQVPLLSNDAKYGSYITINGNDTGLTPNIPTDYVNVALPDTFPGVLEINSDESGYAATINCGDSISDASLIKTDSIDDIIVNKSWEAAFVRVTSATDSNSQYTPHSTTSYTFTQTLEPIKSAEEAEEFGVVVGPVVTQIQNERTAIVRVLYKVTNNVDGTILEYSAQDLECGQDATLSLVVAKDSSVLPDSIDVYMGDNQCRQLQSGVDYTYDQSTGKVEIKSSAFCDSESDDKISECKHNITLDGKVDALYKITYAYETSAGESKIYEESYKAGSTIDYSWLDSDITKNEIGSKEGYTFEWTWPGAVDRCPSAMPAQDIWVTGKFVPNTYEITVKYVDESGNNLVDSSDPISAHYGDELTIQAKEIANYTPDAASKTVTVTGNCEVVFTYTKITGTLVINYCDTYGNTLYSYSQGDEGAINKIAVLSSVQSISAGTNYDINAATVAGFTPTKIKIGDNSVVDYIEDGISFTPTEAQCQSGVNVYIYYAPNTYTLKFDAGSDATVTPSFRKVQYANTYSFDPWAVTSNGASPYSDLPTPKRDGYTFTGWYTTDPATNQTEATKITADSIFLNTEDQTLYAGWQEDNIISYTISWDSLDFDMTDLVWDTESHVYVGSTFVQSASGDTSQSGSPAISVKNTGTVELNVNYSYVPSDEHKTITGQFSSTKANDDDANNDTIPRDVASSVLFSLSGTGRVTQLLNSCFTAGQCVVKVSSNLTGQTNAEGGES